MVKPLSKYTQTLKYGDAFTFLMTLMLTMKVMKVMDYRNAISTFARCACDGQYIVSRLAQISS